MKVVHFPTRDLNEVDGFDETALVAGYRAGLHGEPMPEDKAGQHGWRNGMADSGRLKINSAQREIASQLVQSGRSIFATPHGTFDGENLGKRATNILRLFGANTREDAICIIRDRISDIKKTPNCGKKTVKELQEWSREAIAEQSKAETIAGLVAAGITEKQAQAAIKAIVDGLVPHVTFSQ